MFGAFSFGSRQLASGMAGVVSTAMIVTVNGEDVTARIAAGAVHLLEVLNGRTTAALAFLVKRPSSWRPSVGQTIQLFLGSIKRFAGTVDQRQERQLMERDEEWDEIDIDCLDYNLIPQRFFITSRSYSGQTVGAIVSDLVATYLAADAITASVTPGPTLTTYDIVDKSVAQVLDDLSDISGHIWSISPYKVLDCHPNELSTAPFNPSSMNSTVRTVRARQSRDQYRNVQIIRGATGILQTRTDTAAITERQGVEGGSGRYERFESDESAATAAQANAKADGLLSRYAQLDTEVSFETDRDGLRPGQRLTLTFPDLDVSGTFLVTEVDWEVVYTTESTYRYRVKANSGEVRVPWVNFWKTLMKGTPERSHF